MTPSGHASTNAVGQRAPERVPVYRLFQATVRGLSRIFLPSVDVQGLEHVPETGPCLVVANHQSVLDPILIQSFCPRPLHTMTKSTQFGVPVLGWLVRDHLLGFPVRRYQIDPQAVRVALRRLAAGRAVGVYVEGERSWDGRLQAPRLGTLRLLLKAGVPVIPCAIDGSYDVWPRWGSGLKRAPVRIAFGAPLTLPQLDDRRARERALDAAGAAIMGALRGLLGGSDASVPVEVGGVAESGGG